MKFSTAAILALAAPAVARIHQPRGLKDVNITVATVSDEPMAGQGFNDSSLVGTSVIDDVGVPQLMSSRIAGLSDLISSSDTPIISHDGSWGDSVQYTWSRCDSSNEVSKTLQSGYMSWWTTGYPYRITFENGAGITKSYTLRPGAKYYFTKKSDGSLEVYRSGSQSNKSQCRSYVPVETPIVKHVTYSSVTCNNAYHSMLQNARNQVLNDLLLMSSDWVKTSASSVCTDTTALDGRYNSVTETVSGSITMTKTCESAWEQEFRRTPQEWLIRIGDPGTGYCNVDHYDCDTETNWLGERVSWGQMSVSCPYRLVYRG